jgi:hypothetical protein
LRKRKKHAGRSGKRNTRTPPSLSSQGRETSLMARIYGKRYSRGFATGPLGKCDDLCAPATISGRLHLFPSLRQGHRIKLIRLLVGSLIALFPSLLKHLESRDGSVQVSLFFP